MAKIILYIYTIVSDAKGIEELGADSATRDRVVRYTLFKRDERIKECKISSQ
jgi:hypothetical protein